MSFSVLPSSEFMGHSVNIFKCFVCTEHLIGLGDPEVSETWPYPHVNKSSHAKLEASTEDSGGPQKAGRSSLLYLDENASLKSGHLQQLS